MRFQDRVVFITGASSGIGRALALAFACEGATLALAARRVERLESLAREIESMGRQVAVCACDVTEDADIAKAVDLVLTRFGRIDVVVANAGFGVVGPFETLRVEDYRRQFETNVFALIRTARADLPSLVKSQGSLVLMGSVSGHISIPGNSPYSMSKYAVRAFAESIYFELKPKGVAVTLISPGFVESEIRQVDNLGVHHPGADESIPSWIVMPVEKAARKMLRAIAGRRRELVLTGHGKVAVFLQHYFPAILRLAIRLGLKGRKQPTVRKV